MPKFPSTRSDRSVRPDRSDRPEPRRFSRPNAGAGANRPGGSRDTSWQHSAKTYSNRIKEEKSYQIELVYPGAIRLLGPKKTGVYLDIACGEGTLIRMLSSQVKQAVGIDLSSNLIRLAKEKNIFNADFRVANAQEFARYFDKASFDGVVCTLALQNIEDIDRVIADAATVLKPGAPLVIVINHPVFRMPKQSSWGFDDDKKLMFRRLDAYLTPREIPIAINPSKGRFSPTAPSFHRPLSAYFNVLGAQGLLVEAVEEWVSGRESDSGPRARAENRAREEFPLFMAIKAVKVR